MAFDAIFNKENGQETAKDFIHSEWAKDKIQSLTGEKEKKEQEKLSELNQNLGNSNMEKLVRLSQKEERDIYSTEDIQDQMKAEDSTPLLPEKRPAEKEGFFHRAWGFVKGVGSFMSGKKRLFKGDKKKRGAWGRHFGIAADMLNNKRTEPGQENIYRQHTAFRAKEQLGFNTAVDAEGNIGIRFAVSETQKETDKSEDKKGFLDKVTTGAKRLGGKAGFLGKMLIMGKNELDVENMDYHTFIHLEDPHVTVFRNKKTQIESKKTSIRVPILDSKEIYQLKDAAFFIQYNAQEMEEDVGIKNASFDENILGLQIKADHVDFIPSLESFTADEVTVSTTVFEVPIEGGVTNLRINREGLDWDEASIKVEALSVGDIIKIENGKFTIQNKKNAYKKSIGADFFSIAVSSPDITAGGSVLVEQYGEGWNTIIENGKLKVDTSIFSAEVNDLGYSTKDHKIHAETAAAKTNLWDLSLKLENIGISKEEGFDFKSAKLESRQEFSLFDGNMIGKDVGITVNKNGSDYEMIFRGSVNFGKEGGVFWGTAEQLSITISEGAIQEGALEKLSLHTHLFQLVAENAMVEEGKIMVQQITSEISTSEGDQEDEGLSKTLFGDKSDVFSYIGINGFGVKINEVIIDESGLKISDLSFDSKLTMDFGVFQLEIDVGKQEGALKIPEISIPADQDSPWFSAELDVPIPIMGGPDILGIYGGVEISGGAKVNGGWKLKKDQNAWQTEGSIHPEGAVKAELRAGIRLGNDWIVALKAEGFAKAAAALESEAKVNSTFRIENHKLSLGEEGIKCSYALDANLTAALGARLKGTAFKVFHKKLYEINLKEWNLGAFHANGELLMDGQPSSNIEKSFEWNREPQNAEGVKSYEPARELLLKVNEVIHGSASNEPNSRLALAEEAGELIEKFEEYLQGADADLINDKNNLNEYLKKVAKEFTQAEEAVDKHMQRLMNNKLFQQSAANNSEGKKSDSKQLGKIMSETQKEKKGYLKNKKKTESDLEKSKGEENKAIAKMNSIREKIKKSEETRTSTQSQSKQFEKIEVELARLKEQQRQAREEWKNKVSQRKRIEVELEDLKERRWNKFMFLEEDQTDSISEQEDRNPLLDLLPLGIHEVSVGGQNLGMNLNEDLLKSMYSKHSIKQAKKAQEVDSKAGRANSLHSYVIQHTQQRLAFYQQKIDEKEKVETMYDDQIRSLRWERKEVRKTMKTLKTAVRHTRGLEEGNKKYIDSIQGGTNIARKQEKITNDIQVNVSRRAERFQHEAEELREVLKKDNIEQLKNEEE